MFHKFIIETFIINHSNHTSFVHRSSAWLRMINCIGSLTLPIGQTQHFVLGTVKCETVKQKEANQLCDIIENMINIEN